MITDKHRAFARAVAELARANDMRAFRMTFTLATEAARPQRAFAQVAMSWTANMRPPIILTSEITEHLPENHTS